MDFLNTFSVLVPHGAVALAERSLMVHALLFMLIIAVPVYLLLFFFAWYYRASNTKAKYLPDWEHSKMEELVWWAIPFEIVLVLGALTWSSTHALDPKKPLDSAGAATPLLVQVVALDWKWLFIYPELGVASVNYLALPVGRPVQLSITADAPMNSFWIPSLGGQIYAMTGMTTSLNLVADDVGTYRGGSANYSGIGFAKMSFSVDAMPQEAFDAWVVEIKKYPTALTYGAYKTLAKPSTPKEPLYYSSVEKDLYNSIVMQFKSAPIEKQGRETFPQAPTH